MAERIDIVIQAARGPGASPGQFPSIPSGDNLPGVGRGADEAKRGVEGLAQSVLGLQSAFQGLAVVAVGQQLIGWGVSAGQASLQLEKAEGAARLLSGTTETYNELVRLAKENQTLFGGTLAENIQGLSGFANTANKTGIELSKFSDISQRLNLLSPEQGFEGAAIALKEALAGDVYSLVERFELPRAALKRLSDESLDAAGRLRILDEVLTEQGVAAGAAASQVTDAQKAYNELGAGIDNLTTSIGKLLAEGFEPAARGAARLLGRDGGISQGLDSIRQIGDEAITGATRLVGFAGGWDAAYESLANYLGLPRPPEMGGGGGGGSWDSTGPEQLAASVAEVANVLDIATLAANGQEAALKSASQAAYEAKNAGGGLEAQARAAALALLESGKAGETAAAQLAQSSTQVDQMTAAQYRLASAAAEAQAAMAARIMSDKSDAGYLGAEANAAKIRAEWEQRYQDTLTRTTGSTAQRLALARQELAQTAQYSDARIAKAAEVARLERQLAAEQQANARRGETRSTQSVNTERQAQERRAEEVRRAQERIEEQTDEHYRRLRQSAEDYALSQSRSEEDFQRQKQRLLAEGRIKEAQLLEEEFGITSRRAAEDEARERQRAAEQYGASIADIAQQAGLSGAQAAAAPRVIPGGNASPVGAPVAAGGAQAGRGGLTVILNLDGQAVATAAYPYLDDLLASGVVNISLTAPPASGQATGVGGPRP